MVPDFTKPSAATTVSNPEEVAQILGNSESNQFANSIAINGSDIYNFMSRTGSNNIAIYFGYSMAENYQNSNKVMIIAPVDRNFKTIAYTDCLLYNSNNMNFESSAIDNDGLAGRSSNQYIATGLVRAYIDHFNSNPNKPETRGVLLQRSTLDKFLKNNGNMRLSFGKGSDGSPVVLVSAIASNTRGMEVDALEASSLCPNNCDIY